MRTPLRGRKPDYPFAARVVECIHQSGDMFGRAKLSVEIERGRRCRYVERQITRRILRRGMTHGLRPCRKPKKQREAEAKRHKVSLRCPKEKGRLRKACPRRITDAR